MESVWPVRIHWLHAPVFSVCRWFHLRMRSHDGGAGGGWRLSGLAVGTVERKIEGCFILETTFTLDDFIWTCILMIHHSFPWLLYARIHSPAPPNFMLLCLFVVCLKQSTKSTLCCPCNHRLGGHLLGLQPHRKLTLPQKSLAANASSVKGGGLGMYWELPYTGDNVLPSSHRMPEKKPRARWGIPPWSCWLKCPGDTPEQCRLLPFALGCPPELDVMTLLLKIPPCPLITGCGKIKLVLFRKPLPAGRLSLTVLPTNKLLWATVSDQHGRIGPWVP